MLTPLGTKLAENIFFITENLCDLSQKHPDKFEARNSFDLAEYVAGLAEAFEKKYPDVEWGFTLAPNGKCYDYLTEIDDFARRSIRQDFGLGKSFILDKALIADYFRMNRKTFLEHHPDVIPEDYDETTKSVAAYAKLRESQA